jgi:hypothetical protein
MGWKNRDAMLAFIGDKIMEKFSVTADKIVLCAQGLNANEAVAKDKRLEGEIVGDVKIISGWLAFYVDIAGPLLVQVRIGILKKREQNLYHLDPNDRATVTLFAPTTDLTFEQKVKAEVEAAGHVFVGTERGTADAAVVIAGVVSTQGYVGRKALAFTKPDGSIGFKLETV